MPERYATKTDLVQVNPGDKYLCEWMYVMESVFIIL